MLFRLGLWELLLILPGLLIYFTPTIVAVVRKPGNIGGIFLLNLLAGWTFLGWVVSLLWAVLAQKRKP